MSGIGLGIVVAVVVVVSVPGLTVEVEVEVEGVRFLRRTRGRATSFGKRPKVGSGFIGSSRLIFFSLWKNKQKDSQLQKKEKK